MNRRSAVMTLAGVAAALCVSAGRTWAEQFSILAPLDSGEAIRVSIMTLPPHLLQPPNSPAFIQVNEIREDLGMRLPEKARTEAKFLIKSLSDQATKARGEARRRTESDLQRVRQFQKKLDKSQPDGQRRPT